MGALKVLVGGSWVTVGQDGAPGQPAGVSTDPGNTVVLGSDSLIYAPLDPVAVSADAGNGAVLGTDGLIYVPPLVGPVRYVPEWLSNGGVAPANPLELYGYYSIFAGFCIIEIHCSFGPTTTGGTSGLYFTLPPGVRAGSGEMQVGTAQLLVPGKAGYFGNCQVIGDNIQPSFPNIMATAADFETPAVYGWSFINAANTPKSGIPYVTSGNIIDGGYITVNATYRIEPTP